MKLFTATIVVLTAAVFLQSVSAADDTSVSNIPQTSTLKANKPLNETIEQPPSWTSTLCNEHETIIFSCPINQSPKTVSICYLPSSSPDVQSTMQYRFGKIGEAPELIYPKQPKPIEEAFSFSSHKNSTGFPLQIISFSKGSVVYDVTAASGSRYVRWSPFAGIEVTIASKPTQLISCDKKSVWVNLSPIRKLLKINDNDDALFSDALPKVEVVDSPFPTTKNVTTDSLGAEITISYPAVNDPEIDNEILKFIGDCDWTYAHVKGSKCSNTVAASIVKGEYLVLHFDAYMYAAGTPHGYGDSHTKVYRKINHAWQPIEKSDFFIDSDYCHANINSMIYRQLKPLGLRTLDSASQAEADPDNEPLDLIEEADIYPAAQGIEFAYQQYQLGSYAQTPYPTLIPWKNINNCLRTENQNSK